MSWALIKNNFKLMFRNKWSVVLMILGPLLVIAAISSAFNAMMKSYTPVDTFIAGYHIEEESSFNAAMPIIKDAAENNKIEFREFPSEDAALQGNIENIFQKGEADVFVDFTKGAYHIYKQKDKEIQSNILEYFLNQVTQGLRKDLISGEPNIDIQTVSLDAVPRPDAIDYYGIIYIVYFSWCGIIIMSPIFSSEKKNRIAQRLRISPLAPLSLYLGKALPCIGFTMLLTFLSAVLNTVLYGVSWGNLSHTFLVMAFSIAASSLFSIFIYFLLGNIAVTIGVIFTVVWTTGFIGGSFEAYLYSSTSDKLKEVSPLYYINRTLVEYSTSGSSSYESRCLLYLAAISAVSFAGSLLLSYGKGRKII